MSDVIVSAEAVGEAQRAERMPGALDEPLIRRLVDRAGPRASA